MPSFRNALSFPSPARLVVPRCVQRIHAPVVGPAALLAFALAWPYATEAQEPVCGPHCVKAALEWYGVETPDVLALSDDIQGLGKDGSTLADIEAALLRRGVYTAAVRLPSNSASRINWPYPTILHLRPPRTGEPGHFVVRLPGRDAGAVFFDMAGVQLSWDEFLARQSGAVLLSSPRAIHSAEIAKVTEYDEAAPSWRIAITAAFVCVFAFFAILKSVRHWFQMFFTH